MKTKLRVIVGLEKDENAFPFVIGAFNDDYLRDLPLEDEDRVITEMKKTWTMDPNYYDWREILVEVEADLLPLFIPPTIIAKVV